MTTLIFLLTACGNKTETETATPVDTSVETDTQETDTEETATEEFAFESSDLVGTWIGPCFPSPQGDGSFNQLTFEMTETTWDLDYIAHGNEECTAPFMTVNIAGDYTLDGASDVADGARNGFFGFTTKTVTPNMEPAVSVVNGACGIETAEVGTAFDFSDGCPGLGGYPVADCPGDFDIVMLSEEGTVLHFGARPTDNNMCSEDKRPTTFDGGAAVTKQ